MARIKILYYNWVDFDDAEQRGGGVSVYQRNLIAAATRQGDVAYFLSSGISYSPFSRRPFIRAMRSRLHGLRKFELVNSTFLSPGHAAFGQDVAHAPEMEAVFIDFLRTHGPFDVVHFNNLEGVPVSFLRLAREHHSDTKVIYSLHNYFPFCPQVNLWFQEKASCKDFADGRKCVNCLPTAQNARATLRFYQLDYCLRRLGIPAQTALYRMITQTVHGPVYRGYKWACGAFRALRSQVRAVLGRGKTVKPAKAAVILDPATAAKFAARRRLFIDSLNSYADHILAVSRRVAELALGFGLDPARVRTAYIGTRFAETQTARCTTEVSPGHAVRIEAGSTEEAATPMLRMVYLGYMRRDKGFYFLLDALEKMPAALARRLGLVFAAKLWDQYAYERIKRMAHRFAAVTFYDGYTHAQLPRILADVDLGVVPVLWEDNLPQVAIECVASGVPILTSDRGGASELLDCPSLVFRAGSFASFYGRLQAILDDPSLLRTALAGRAPLYTPAQHYEHLRNHFYLPAAEPAADRVEAPARTAEPGFCPTVS